MSSTYCCGPQLLKMQLLRGFSSRKCLLRADTWKHRHSKTVYAALSEVAETQKVDMRVFVKLSVAGNTGRLDLTDMRLSEIPSEVFELEELEELSLAGNCITELPESIGALSQLKRLGLAGNMLQGLPSSLGLLTNLEGLWLHGNQLGHLPETIGNLASLKQLSLSGNALTCLPPSITRLSALEELTIAGNQLSGLPANFAAHFPKLEKLALNGNCITRLQWDLQSESSGTDVCLPALEELWLQGNRLEAMDIGTLPSQQLLPKLKKLSLADNAMTTLPQWVASLPALETLYLYGNNLMPSGVQGLNDARGLWETLRSIWLEGNPELAWSSVDHLLRQAAAAPVLKNLGLDDNQLRSADAALITSLSHKLRRGEVLDSGSRYFKLQLGPAAAAAAYASTSALSAASTSAHTPDTSISNGNGRPDPSLPNAAVPESSHSGDGDGRIQPATMYLSASGSAVPSPVLVVAFGSAPGVPNWGGLLGKLYAQEKDKEEAKAFDVLYVVDPARDWYGLGDDDAFADLSSRLAAATSRYPHVIMLGDSMGATAALACSRLATAVLAFCPQVDLDTASIRPARPTHWFSALARRVVDAVTDSAAAVTVLTGTWQHDLDQVNLLPSKRVRVKVFNVDSHRLALALERDGRLATLVKDTVLQCQGIKTNNVRLSNVL